MLGIGAVAGPSAAKSALADLVPANVVAGGGLAAGFAYPPSSLPPNTYGVTGQDPKVLGRSALKLLGVPDWLRQQWRDQAQHVPVIDPDLAACQSFSLAAKISMQRDRNMARAEAAFWDYGFWKEAREKFNKRFGYIDW